jgi:glycosyltransferase involved in cell wall biosynthesis
MTDASPDLIVLVPAYKEELTISMVVTLSLKHAAKVIVVDDGSPDRTSELARAAGAEVIRQEPNQGKAAALKVGFKRCQELKPKCVVMMDGDGQMDPDQLLAVASPVLKGQADLVIGSRFIGEEVDIPKYRIFGQKVLNSATNMSSDVKITDSQSGFRALSGKALENMDFASDSFNIESDMIVHFAQRKLKIVEVPISVRYDVPNAHKQKPLKHGLAVLSRIITIIGYRRPLIVFGIPGIIALVLGLFLCFEAFNDTIVLFNWQLSSQGFAGIAAFGIGLFLCFAAMVLNSLSMLMQNLHMTIRNR